MAPKHRPKTKQTNIKDALISQSVKSKQNDNQQEESSSHIIVPNYLRKPNNIRSPESGAYHCSTISRVYFRSNSNLDEIVKDYAKMNKLGDCASYTSGIMRKIVSDPSGKLLPPFIRFKFNTPYHEMMGRELLIYPKITDVDKHIKFINDNHLKFCTVNMQNEVHDASVKYIVEKIKDRGNTKNFRKYKYVAAEKGVRRYFESHAMTKEIYLRDVDWRDLSEYSNFGKLIRERLPENTTEEDFENEAESVMRQVRQYPPHYDSVLRHLALNPRYTFIRNMMTEMEEKKIASSIEVFYEKSNARNILILNPEYTRKQVYEMYCSSNSYLRKLPPFHNLYYKPGDLYKNIEYYLNPHNRYRSESETHEQNKSNRPQQKQPALLSINMKRKWRCVRNNETAVEISRPETASTEGTSRTSALRNIQHEIESSQSNDSNISKETVVNLELAKLGNATPFPEVAEKGIVEIPRREVFQIAPEVISEKTLEKVPEYVTECEVPMETLRLSIIPQRFLNDIKPQAAELAITKLMTRDKKFIYLVKMELLAAYPDNFESLWNARKKQILLNFIHFSMSENLQHLKEIISECPEQQKNNMLQLIDDLISPPGTSFSVPQKETPKTPLRANIKVERQPNDSKNYDNVATPSGKIPVASVLPVMANCSESSPCSSDVEFVEKSQQIIAVNESQDETEQFLKELEECAHDEFLKRLNPKNQPVAGTSVQRFSDETMEKLKEFELKSVTDESAERKSSKRKATLRKPSAPKRKTVAREKIEYLDSPVHDIPGDDDQIEDINDVLNHDFSVFLSSQLIDVEMRIGNDVARTHAEKFFTFVPLPNNHIQNSNSASCFLIDIKSVLYQHGSKQFELIINLPQFSLFHITIRNKNIKSVLNLKDIEWSSLLELLAIVENYHYHWDRPTRSYNVENGELFIINQLDMYFATCSKFKTFQFVLNGDYVDCYNSIAVSHLNFDLTSAINPSILREISSLHLSN